MNPYNPTRTHLMERLGSLKKMVRGCEHFLYDREGTRYLDFLSQYGVVSFGHNHPELVAALQECLAAQQPGNGPLLAYLEAAWLENLGVRVTWARLPWAALIDRLYHPPPPQVWPMGWMADYVDPDSFLRVAQCRKNTRWLNEEYEELIETARRVLDPERRMEMYRQADRILVEEAPIVPLTYRRAHYLVKPWVRFPPMGHYLWLWKDFIIEPH